MTNGAFVRLIVLIFAAMKLGLLIILMSISICLLSSCRKCYTCTAQTEFGEIERQVCGQKSNIRPLIEHLTTYADTAGGVGPWDCK